MGRLLDAYDRLQAQPFGQWTAQNSDPGLRQMNSQRSALTSALRKGIRNARRKGDAATVAANINMANAYGLQATGIGSYEARQAGSATFADQTRKQTAINADLANRAADGVRKVGDMTLKDVPSTGRSGPMTYAASGNILNARQNLFKRMQAEGGDADAYRSEAASLGVTDSGLTAAIKRRDGVKDSPRETLAKPTKPAAKEDEVKGSAGGDAITGGSGSLATAAPPTDPLKTAAQEVATPAPRNTSLRGSEEKAGYRSVAIDEDPPEGMELVGMRGGNRLYAPMKDVYGETKRANPDATAPGSNRISGPVVIDEDRPDVIRKGYQDRMNADPQMRQAADNFGKDPGARTGATSPAQPLPPRGPASQPEIIRNPPRSDGYQARSQEEDWARDRTNVAAAREREANTVTMADVTRKYGESGRDRDMAAMGINPRTGAQLTKDDVKVNVKPSPSGDRFVERTREEASKPRLRRHKR